MTDLREKVLELIFAGDSSTDISKKFCVTHKTAYSIKSKYEEAGSVRDHLGPANHVLLALGQRKTRY